MRGRERVRGQRRSNIGLDKAETAETGLDKTATDNKKPAPFGAGLKLERWIAYFEAEDGWDEFSRIWRHSFSRRSSTWAGIVEVADTAEVLVWEAVFVCMSILLALEVCASNVLVRGKFHSVKSL